MPHIHLEHTEKCISDRKQREIEIDNLEKINPDNARFIRNYISFPCQKKSFVFFFNNDFYLLTAADCAIDYDQNEWIVNILKAGLNGRNIKYYDCRKSYHLDDELRAKRLHNIQFKDYIHEINYTYCDAAGRTYAVCTEIKWIDSLVNQELINYNYNKFVKMLIKDKRKDCINEAKELYRENITYITEYETFKTIDHLIKQLNNYGNNKEGKLKATT